jgi:hypothetical protein
MTMKPAFPALGASMARAHARSPTGVGAWVPSCRGLGIAKILKKLQLHPRQGCSLDVVQIQRSGREGNVKTNRSNHGWRALWRPDSHGKPDGPPDSTGSLRRLRSVNARAARCAVFMAPIVLTGCQPAVFDPQGFIGLARR